MKRYCDNCNNEEETKIVRKTETYNVCGEDITVEADVLVCAECGEELFCEELDNATLVKAYNEYRVRHKLLLPEEIKKIREQYGLSQRSFAKLLNWGDKTIFRYENGSIQDKAHNSILLFLKEPENMRSYLNENEVSITDKQIKNILHRIDQIEQGESYKEKHFCSSLFASEPNQENGFREFDYEKICAMIIFFACNNKRLLKTKLMKLLHYADMIFYKENGISISGLRYVHLPYGPVPDNFEIILERLQKDNLIHIDINFHNGYEKHQVISDSKLPEGVLSEEEINILERINIKFASFGSVEISEYSHKEKGYTSTNPGDIIPYTYAKYIEL